MHKVSKNACSHVMFDCMIKFYADPVNDDDAMKSLGVAVTMKITNIGTQGYPGVGKTSVLDLAMGKDPAPTRTSTDCVDPPLHHMMIKHEDSDEWEKVTTDEMFQMVCGAVKKKIDEIPPDEAESDEPIDVDGLSISSEDASITVTATTNRRTTQSTTRHVTPVIEQVLPPLAGSSDPTPNLLTDHLPGPSHDSSRDSSNSVPPSIWFSELMNQLTQKAGYEKSGVIFNSHWVFVNDCGGQPPFLDAAALFPLNRCLQIFPIKLDELLDEKAEFSYFVNNERAKINECVMLTHKEVIETMAKSVASIEPPHTSSANVYPSVAKFTIVGTFYDQINQCYETLEARVSTLETLLEPCESFHVGSELILLLSAIMQNTKERKDLTKKLQELIFNTSYVTTVVNMRLCWFALYLSLLTKAEKDKKVVLTLEECYMVSEFLSMSNDEIKDTIQLFHYFGLIIDFDTPFAHLQDYMNFFAKPVLKTVSQIISVAFPNLKFLKGQGIVSGEDKKQLQYYGFLRLRTVKKSLDSKLTAEFLLDILKRVKIIAELPGKEYFMPCALSYAPDKLNKLSHPWVIRLREKRGIRLVNVPIPVGYLPTLIVFLLNNSIFSTNCKKRQYRNFINLQYRPGGTVYFVERHLQLEVYYSLCDDLPDQCSVIRRLVLQSIELTEKRLTIKEGPIIKVDSFVCSCGKGSGHHTCAYNPCSRILECEETGKICTSVNSKHLHWLGMSH